MPASSHMVLASSGSFLITPGLGLMIWTLVIFTATMLLLRRLAFPRIRDALDRRQKAIEDSIDTAERTREEAEKLLAEYRERLRDARGQAEEIVTRARRSAEEHEREAVEAARARGENLLEQSRRDIELATARALAEIRDEVTNLTILATEKVTRKTLDSADQRRLVEEALAELDFSALSASDN
ncbi:MAG TPA: F0F1 ATP synthase subunit B [Solirubrobacteraceae bacterium]|nr:F0F1 ATP synthase subunit B [Solirubrobacteraceae bacterium]